MKKITIVLLFVILCAGVFACSMFTKTIDGKTLVGNNEDGPYPDVITWFSPAEEGKYGVCYLGYKRDFFPQGGMNDQGLCFDGFATEYKPITETMNKPDLDWNLIPHIMETCTTIDDVIAEFDKYKLHALESAMLMFVDRTGDSVIIEGDEFIRKEGDFQIITNFYQSEVKEGEKTGCARYDNLLDQLPGLEVTIEDFTKALASAHAEGKYSTQFSNIFDLNTLKLYLYHFHNYTNLVVIDVSEELAKGEHFIDIPSLFPKLFAYDSFIEQQSRTLAVKLDTVLKVKGLSAARKIYPELIEKNKIVFSYPLDENEMNLMGYAYLTDGKFDEAIFLFMINVEHFPDSWNVYDSLGEAYMEADEIELSIQNYEKSIELNPENSGGVERLKELKKIK